MAFNTKVDVADTELEENEAVVAEAEDVTLEDEALVEAESDTDEDDEEADESEDSLTYSNGVIEKIVAMATREVPHVLGMKGNLMHFVQEQFGAENLTKGVTVEVTDDNRVVVNISVIIEYGAYAPAIFDDVKARVTERLAAMTGLEVAGVNLRIEDVITPRSTSTAPASTNNLPKGTGLFWQVLSVKTQGMVFGSLGGKTAQPHPRVDQFAQYHIIRMHIHLERSSF